MNHPSEDRLLEYALEISEADRDRADIGNHLATCRECSARLEDIRKDIEIIAGVRPRGRVLQAPAPKARHGWVYAASKAAALVIFGVLVGFAGSAWLSQEPAAVSPAYVTLTPPEGPLAGCAVSDATSMSSRYYDEILQAGE
jgi:hypothetical protein